MEFELLPQSSAGERFVKLTEEHAPFVAERADEHDRAGTFPYEAFEVMQESGLLRATVPEELGGLGLTSLRDLAIGLGRLGRGDGSVAVALNMHLCTTWTVARVWRDTVTAGLAAADTTALLERVSHGAVLMACAAELGTDANHPFVDLTRADGGWVLNGRKTFGTLAPIADVIFLSCRSQVGPIPQSHWALVSKGAPGVIVPDNWDALGMRATGSHDVVFDQVRVRDDQVMPPVPWGEDHEHSLVLAVTSGIGLVASFLGIAERAHDVAIQTASTRIKAPTGRPLAERPGVQRLIAENEIDLATCRALVDSTGRLIDQHITEPFDMPTIVELHALNAQFQGAKHEVTRRAIAIVDRALTIAGGSGYLANHPLSRLYRDVRAGPLMQPFSPNETHEYIGKVALGLDPAIQT